MKCSADPDQGRAKNTAKIGERNYKNCTCVQQRTLRDVSGWRRPAIDLDQVPDAGPAVWLIQRKFH